MKYIFTLLLLSFTISLSAQEDTIIPITLQQGAHQDTVQVGDDPIFTIVQESPKFPGGNTELYAFVGQKMRYPKEAKGHGIQGTVYVRLLINKDGCIDTNDIHILKGVHSSLDNETIRIVKEMPCWTPGYQHGKAVRVYYNLPIRFTLMD